MIRTTITCDHAGCLALYLPDVDAGSDVLGRAAQQVGWRRTTASGHECPACVTGRGPVLERGECPTCTGRTVDLPNGQTCHYCQTVTVA
ncbi:hypothetical protein [Streptomyces sp. NRRL F-5065]|uniref:hypothetical protein n=1 Tax=Streptomyces sp. NRRL F-5065 TaxID=1463855 RepID=UPI0004BFA14F|nr:hypothetical protein [Streptomyces sp. NRRL F-5065]